MLLDTDFFLKSFSGKIWVVLSFSDRYHQAVLLAYSHPY